MRQLLSDLAVFRRWLTCERVLHIAYGSCPLSRTCWIRLLMAAARWPPGSEPAKRNVLFSTSHPQMRCCYERGRSPMNPARRATRSR